MDRASAAGVVVIGIGVDVVDVRRFATASIRSPRLLARLFTEDELAMTHTRRRELPEDSLTVTRLRSLAARWAAKEAVSKVLVDTQGLSWHECEILTGTRGQPFVRTSGAVARAALERGIDAWQVSLSHDGDTAIAFVLAGRDVP